MYVVTQGQMPGIYSNYSRVQSAIFGHADAAFKSFQTLEEAYHYAGAYLGRDYFVDLDQNPGAPKGFDLGFQRQIQPACQFLQIAVGRNFRNEAERRIPNFGDY